MIISLSCGNIIAGFIFLIFCHLLYLVAFSSIVWLKLLLGHAPSYMPFIRTPYIPVRRGLRSATRGSLVKSSARRETLDGRSIHINSLYMPADLEETPPPLRLPILIQPGFTPPSKLSSSEKATLYIEWS